MSVLFLLICLTKLQRSNKIRRKYHNQFIENTPALGMNWSAFNKKRQTSKDSKKERLVPVHKNQNTKDSQEKEPVEKPHKRFRFQSHSNINKQSEKSSEQQISKLMTDEKKLNYTLAEYEHIESQNKQYINTLKKLQNEIKQLQNETNTHKQAKESFEKQISELTADNKKLKQMLTEYVQTKSKIDELTTEHELLREENKQFKNEINTYKQTKESFEKQISELAADNEKLQSELTEFAKAESKIAEMTNEVKRLQKEEFQVEQISENQIVTETALEVETPVNKKTTKRNKIKKKQHRTVKGIKQKLCKKCNEWKPESEFHKNSSSKDNLAASCKKCKNNAAREHRKQLKASKK
ncbi:MAG: hypothetical protein JXA96_04005 [Sedimentisphaerales bacterium]|nr:hypothetical protein [Sedimentisphaerales bacterium]